MKELTLEILAPYLPYSILGTDNSKDYYSLDLMSVYNQDEKYQKRNISYWLIYHIKPFLRPISDLNKEINHNGQTFIPRNGIVNLMLALEPESFDCVESGHIWFDTIVFNNGIKSLPYSCMMKLYKWHFDIHDLINKGLAVDFNTL